MMGLTFTSALKVGQALQWRHVLMAAAVLAGLHFFFFANFSVRLEVVAGALPTPATSPPAKDPIVVSENGTTPSHFPGGGKEEEGKPDPNEEYVAMCMSVKDQALDLVEVFVHHYHHMGIRRFYIMDDGSDPPLSSYQYPGVPRSALTFSWNDPAQREGYMQLRMYIWCIERYASLHKWMAFTDGDEFFDTPGTETLREVLETFEKNETVGAVGVNWRMHTSNGLLKRPASARQSFTECIYDDEERSGENSDNNHIKTIIKTSKAGSPINPHKFSTTDGSITVGENGDEITSEAWRMPITRNRIGLHHYAVKSWEEYEEKMYRGNGMSDPKAVDFWHKIEDEKPHVDCQEMTRYYP